MPWVVDDNPAPPKRGWVPDTAPAAPAAKSDGLLSDIVKSAAAGVGRLVDQGLGQFGDYAEHVFTQPLDQALAVAGAVTGRDTAPARAGLKAVASVAMPKTSAQIGADRAAAGLDHTPQTTAGKYARTVAEFAPNALLSPGNALTRAAAVVVPAIASEAAGENFHGKSLGPIDLEPVARLGGAMAGGALVAPNALTSPRAQADPLDSAADALRPYLNVGQARTEANALRDVGAEPALISVGGEPVKAMVRAAASRQTPARTLVQDRAEASAINLQDRLQRQGRVISSDPTPLPEIEAGIEGRMSSAATPPEGSPGFAGHLVSQRLNSARDQAEAAVNTAYADARAAGPTGAHFPMEQRPQIAADIRDAVADYHPDNIPRVTTALGKLDKTGTLTVDDMFNLRRQLTQLRASADPVEAGAAARAVRRIDDITDDAVDAGKLTGDPEAVGAYKLANSKRAAFGRNFEGNDLVAQLTDRVWRGDSGRTVKVAPEDVSSALFGRGPGVANRPDLTRNLITLRERLGGEQSPEWQAVQQEAVSRILAQDAGKPTYGRSLTAFRTANPELAEILIPPRAQGQVAQAQSQVQAAQADREALRTGQGFLNADSEQFAADAAPMDPARNSLARASARRAYDAKVGASPGAAPGAGRLVATGAEQRLRNRALLGEDDANRLEAGVAAELKTNKDLQYVAPNGGSPTQPRTADAQHLEKAVQIADTAQKGIRALHGDLTAWLELMKGHFRTRGLDDAGAEALAKASTDPSELNNLLAAVERQQGGHAAAPKLLAILREAQRRALAAPRFAAPAALSGN